MARNAGASRRARVVRAPFVGTPLTAVREPVDTVEALRTWGADAPQIVVTQPVAPRDTLALVEPLAAALRQALEHELATTRPQVRPPQRVLYLIWHEPWMTLARDTYLSNMLAQVNWLADVQQVLLSSEPFAFTDAHADEVRAQCPNATLRRGGVNCRTRHNRAWTCSNP